MEKLTIFMGKLGKIWLITGIIFLSFLTKPVLAFCGFYVAKADSSLYNQASQVIIARESNRTVLTMANDYQGDVKDFALVVPVPVVLEQGQVTLGEGKILERLDAFSSPRLVEYYDSNPCAVNENLPSSAPSTARDSLEKVGGVRQQNSLGVTVERQFSVGEYNILILKATESKGLETWLRQNGYKIPQGASQLLQPYIKQNMRFFVAKVNLKEFAKTGFKTLRPLRIAYESSQFMLPIRLGMINGKGEQDLIVYLLSPQGQIELTNYRTVKVPSDVDIPEFVQQQFKEFYKAMFQKAYQRENKKAGFLEYAWNMANCDPCSAEPLTPEELRKAGVFWLNSPAGNNVFITRLHVRYTRDKFPQDLQFQQTGNRQLFQGRYVIRHPFRGEMNCDAAQTYKQSVKTRQEQEAQTLANLTGWGINDIRKRIDFVQPVNKPWWQNF